MKNIIFGDNVVTLADSLYITIVSMTIVFAILLLISLSLGLLKIFAKLGGAEEIKKTTNKAVNKKQGSNINQTNTPVATAYQFENLKYKIEDEGVRLAIMVASIHATEELGHNNIKINYVREI